MAFIIADSGSTKTQWCLIRENGEPVIYNTSGINPVYLSEEHIVGLLEKEFPFTDTPISSVWFYGAGCAFPEKNGKVREALGRYFKCTQVEIASDLLGAARALCGREPGIACILGTGSNSCYYDGEKIAGNISPLGFILGDEGSGADLGKKFLADLLKGLLPVELKNQFFAAYSCVYAEIIDKVYCQPWPNRYMAGLTPFIREHMDCPEIEQLVLDAFDAFIRRCLLRYPDIERLPVYFTGSVACVFREQLEKQLGKYGLTVRTFCRTPMEGLIKYHYRG